MFHTQYATYLTIFFCIQAVLAQDNTDASVTVDILYFVGGRTSMTWTEEFTPHIDIGIEEGHAADLVRQSPSSYVLCVSTGESIPSLCTSILDPNLAESLNDIPMQPLYDGITEISAWLQSKDDPPNVLLHSIGKPSFLYIWDSPQDAIAGLKCRLPLAWGYQKAAIERYLSLAVAQSAMDNEENKSLMLHIGGQTRQNGWTLLDIDSANEVSADVITSMDDLHMYQDGSVTAVYASHILEHGSVRQTSRCGGSDGQLKTHKVDVTGAASIGLNGIGHELGIFSGGEIAKALSEWRRVLKPGGLLFVAVPDLAVLTRLYLNGDDDERELVMTIMYGGQSTPYDFHSVGFDFRSLTKLLTASGFCSVSRVEAPFGLFQDTSEMYVMGKFLSLNVIATACHPENSEMGKLKESDPKAFEKVSNAMRKEMLREVYEVRSRVLIPYTHANGKIVPIYSD